MSSVAKWKLMYYKHPKPGMARATPELLAAMRCFDGWQNSLDRGMLLQPAVATMKRTVAIKQAESEEKGGAGGGVGPVDEMVT